MRAKLSQVEAPGAPARSWKPYPAYKDTGVEWLGKVPEHWEVKMVKRLCLIKRGASPRPIDNPIYFDENGEYSWVRISDVTASTKYLQSTDQKLSTLGKSKSVPLEPGELFLSIAGSVGKPIITAIKCCIHDGFVYFVGLKQNREYLFYLFSGGELYRGLGKIGTQLNLNTDTVGEMKIPVPPLPEQRAISVYLHDRTRKIDSLIEKKQKLIELLKEERAAVINQAVTKGLDPRAPMRDSGVEWLEEIPRHWKIKKLKYLVTLVNEKNGSESPELRIALENIESYTGKLINLDSEITLEGETKVFNRGDVLFNKLRPYLAKVYNAKTNGVCVGELLVFRPSKSLISDFLYYRVLSEDFIKKVNSSTYGAKMPRASWEFIGNISIPFPAIEEQGEIVKFIESEYGGTGRVISKIEKEIALLQEYRTALISEVVTGKIDVRGDIEHRARGLS